MTTPSNRRFDYSAWQRVVGHAQLLCSEVEEAIAPFGFEVLGDLSFLERRLHRFYVYLSIPQNAQLGQAEYTFCRNLLSLDEPANPLRRIRVIVLRSGAEVLPQGQDATLYIKALHLPSGVGLWDAYLNYITLSPLAITQAKLHEIGRFRFSASARRYVYQLTIMNYYLQEQSFRGRYDAGPLLAELSSSPSRNLETGEPPEFPATERDEKLLRDLVLPINQLISREISHGMDTIEMVMQDLHGETQNSYLISQSTFQEMRSKIGRRYEEFRTLL